MASVIEHTEKETEKETDDEVFEFDAPKIKDFTNKEYQTQKRRIERLLGTHGNPGIPQDPSKTPNKPTKKQIKAPAPRKTFFSELFKEAGTKSSTDKSTNKSSTSSIKSSTDSTDIFDQSVDDRWFEKKEKEMEIFNDISVKSILSSTIKKDPYLTKDLFLSDDEAEILPQLKVIATPPIHINRNKKGLNSAEFDPKEIEELSKSLSPLYYTQDKE